MFVRINLIAAALVLSPICNPSQYPAAQATIFFNAPQISTVEASDTTVTLNRHLYIVPTSI